jgi:hypothetical protein
MLFAFTAFFSCSLFLIVFMRCHRINYHVINITYLLDFICDPFLIIMNAIGSREIVGDMNFHFHGN